MQHESCRVFCFRWPGSIRRICVLYVYNYIYIILYIKIDYTLCTDIVKAKYNQQTRASLAKHSKSTKQCLCAQIKHVYPTRVE